MSAPAYGARHSLRQRAIALGAALTSYPDPQIGWLAVGTAALRRLAHSGEFDAVLSSSPPFTTNLMLALARLRIPWVADFRDLWAESEARESAVRRVLDGALERWTLRRAAAVTVISERMADIVRARVPHLPVNAIPNAYDAAEWSDAPFEHEERCTIVYAGGLYHGRADLSPLFRVLRRMIDRRSIGEREIGVDIYSADEPWLREAVAAHGMRGIVRIRGVVARGEAMRAERRADRLLVLRWNGSHADSIVPAKLFEYLGARRRIMAFGGPASSEVARILTETGAGIACADEAALEREIDAAVRARRSGPPAVIAPEASAPYEAHVLAERFARVLDAAVAARASADEQQRLSGRDLRVAERRR